MIVVVLRCYRPGTAGRFHPAGRPTSREWRSPASDYHRIACTATISSTARNGVGRRSPPHWAP